MSDENVVIKELEPWQKLAELEELSDIAAVSEYIDNLTSEEQRRCFSRLSGAEQEYLIAQLDTQVAADVLESLPERQSTDILQALEPEVAADIIEMLPNHIGADLLMEMSAEDSEAVLAEIDDVIEAAQIRNLATYEWDTAGGLMIDEFLTASLNSTTGQVIQELSAYAEDHDDVEIQYVYVINDDGQLAGVLRLRDLVLKKPSTSIKAVLNWNPATVSVNDDLKTLVSVFEENSFLAMPVVNNEKALVGIITRKAVREATAQQQTEDYLRASGIVAGEELRSMPLLTRSRRRLAWLAPNIGLNLVAASIISRYEDTLQAVIALAVFLPIISDMSGCSGNQAVAVSIRELSLGVIRPTEYLRIIWKEGFLGIINGVILGTILGLIALIWKGSLVLACVIGGALCLNTILSVLLGGLVPLLLKRLKVDPALASGPILTTCTDMCGFLLVLSLASAVLPMLK